jgi:hypothetical protein
MKVGYDHIMEEKDNTGTEKNRHEIDIILDEVR